MLLAIWAGIFKNRVKEIMIKKILLFIFISTFFACSNAKRMESPTPENQTQQTNLPLETKTATPTEKVVKVKAGKKQKYYYFRAKRLCLEGARKHKESLKDCITRLKEQN